MWKFVLFVALLCCGSEASGISCKNEVGVDVDWYILYKLPKLKNTDDGTSYYYIDPAIVSKPEHKKPINHQNGVLANTLAPYFDKTPGVGFIAYNDATKPNQNRGHSKGFVMMDETSGFWLLHSTPKFPSKRERNSFFPASGETNSQTFICVTFPYATFSLIGLHLQCIKAHIFEHDIPNDFHQSLKDAVNNQRCDPNTLPLSYPLQSIGGQEFKGFVSKVSTDVKVGDLYVTIADTINSHVNVQTWGRQRNRADDYKPDNRYHVINVKCISIDGKKWKPSHDHSKWCVSESEDWTCIADSNRAVSQFDRPGGALCINNKRVTDIFKSFIKGEDECSEEAGPSQDHTKNHSDPIILSLLVLLFCFLL